MVATLQIEHAHELVALAGPAGPRRGREQGEVAAIEDGAVAVGEDGLILAAGPTDTVRAAVMLAEEARIIDASGRAVLPGFVDAQTHAVFAGDRVDEFVRRLEGADYLEILAAGGGILSTVRATREASAGDLLARAQETMEAMLRHGTTTVEVKSGYGLSTADELKMLRVVRALHDTAPQTVVGTLLAAHAVPPEYRDDADGYVRLVCEETIPTVASEGLARYCDVFCEQGIFTVEQSRRVLGAGQKHGLVPKLHAEQKGRTGGAQLAAELQAASADHLDHTNDEDMAALARAGTVAVLLPGASFILGEPHGAPARRMIEPGVPVALATDFNPGTCPILSMPVIVGLACLRLGLSPAEALVATTINAAHAIGLGDEVGSLEPGKRADLLILDAPSYRYLPYYFAANLVHTVVKDGLVLVEEGRRQEIE
ncbi:MAG: imidazolonepropionase [Chloroflexi bacterium]|nr:imidazolonepropionase [Chloroflexota bacterium]